MSIPQKIHYCWFGRNPLPKLAQKCIKSWRKYCPDYEIIEWNEDNYDLSAAPLYVRQAYEAKKWAFVTDYVRLQVVYDHGGIYLDTDVELIKRLDSLLKSDAYFGLEDGKHIATGLGFGAIKGAPILQELMEDYRHIPFVMPDGSYDTKTCPVRNTEVFLRHGLRQDDSRQILDGDILILPSVYLCPISYFTGDRKRNLKTVSIHWFSASWQTEEQRAKAKQMNKEMQEIKRRGAVNDFLHIPHRIALKLLGETRYEELKKRFKK